MHHHTKKIIGELCNYMGYDLDSSMCKELEEHVKQCPECREYIKSIKLTVNLCKDAYKEEPVPDEVKDNLLKKLNLKKGS